MVGFGVLDAGLIHPDEYIFSLFSSA